jgi:hypothetical protein
VGKGTLWAGKGRYMAEPSRAAPWETRSGTRVGVAGLYKDPSAPPTPLMILLLLFLQKQSLAFAVYLFGIGTLLTGPGLKKSTCDNALTMTSPVHW